MPSWTKVAAKSEIPTDTGKIVEVGDRQIALFQFEGKFYAIDNICPHRAGPLGAGALEESVVTCPWHGWEFDVTTGQSPVNPAAKVTCFPVKVEGEDVWVEV